MIGPRARRGERSAFSKWLHQFTQTPRRRITIEFTRGLIEHQLLPAFVVAFGSMPFNLRNTIAAIIAVRLFPSRNG